ncbi:hypothetical protein TSOC_003262 [Tetrabaena socialis]|uniref:Ankyrin repeat domain-containing protein n=1 Tax=Tetrabaena socialis TaxID=47790 RepID=A0A2J8ABY2_9CHLO|nr:hypothetical protein TSOC_003262 [Tetrabaena socialis]|eukprot:PNH10038.1 hypothetical protein TSOC_003262 [Tetrabaena socialis]
MRTLARQQRLELPHLTARSGSIANLEVLLARDDMPAMLDHDLFMATAAAGQLGVCIWLRERGCCRNDRLVLRAAARAGQQAVCEWLLANGCPEVDTNGVAAASAAEGGHVGLMDWLLPHADGSHVAAMLMGAAEGCDLPTLQRLLQTHFLGGCQPSTSIPTADGQAKLEWLEARGYPRGTWACSEAAAAPDALARLQWLRQRGYPLDEFCGPCGQRGGAAGSAGRAGNVEARQYVLGQGVRMSSTLLLAAAAQGGHVAVMEVLHAHGAHMSEETVRTAAAAAHLPAVAWLVEELGAAAALTASVFAAAARAGSMELLRWLRAWSCPWDATVFAAAAEGGSEEQLEWLVEQGCPMGDDGEPYVPAVRHGDMFMLRCLRRLDCPWGLDGRTLTRAVTEFTGGSRAHVQHVLSWLLDQGCPVDWDAVEAAAQRNTELMGWLQAQRKQRAPDDGEPYVRALRLGDMVMLRCLRRLGCPWGPKRSALTSVVRDWTGCANFGIAPGEHVQRMFGWLLDQGCPVDWDAVESAAQLDDDNEELMRWLRAQRKQRAHAGSGPRLGMRALGW